MGASFSGRAGANEAAGGAGVASFAVVLCAMMVAMCAYWWKQVKRLTSVAWEGHCVEHVEWRLSHVDGGDVPMLRGKKCTSAVVGEF